MDKVCGLIYHRKWKHFCFMTSELLSFESSVEVVIPQTEKKKRSHLNRIRMVPPCVKITMQFF